MIEKPPKRSYLNSSRVKVDKKGCGFVVTTKESSRLILWGCFFQSSRIKLEEIEIDYFRIETYSEAYFPDLEN